MGTCRPRTDNGLRAHEDQHRRADELPTGDWISVMALAAVNGIEDVFRLLLRTA